MNSKKVYFTIRKFKIDIYEGSQKFIQNVYYENTKDEFSIFLTYFFDSATPLIFELLSQMLTTKYGMERGTELANLTWDSLFLSVS